MKPLQAHPLNEGRRLSPDPCEVVEGSAHRDHGHPQSVSIFVGEYLLPRTPETYERDLGPGRPDALDDLALLLRRRPAELGGLDPSDDQSWEATATGSDELIKDLWSRAVEVHREAPLSRFPAYHLRDVRSVDTILKLRTIQTVECPANRLPIGSDDVQRVQPVSMLDVHDPRHDAVHRQSADCKGSPFFCRRQHFIHHILVIHGIYEDAQHIALAQGLHRDHRSRFSSWISLRMCSTSYSSRHSG